MRNRFSKGLSQTRVKNRRGISNVVTSGILLSAISIIGVMMLGWSNSSILEQKQEIETVFNTNINKINEELIFENVWFATTPSPNHLNVTLANTGVLGLNVTEIHVTNTTGTNNTTFINYLTDGGIQKANSFSVNATYAWQSGDELDILVLTDRGNQFITQVIAP
ncbi:MAG: hypothetical protein ACE5GR_00885 [Nitrosopumilus sp.]